MLSKLLLRRPAWLVNALLAIMFLSHPTFGYIPIDRLEFAKIENLIRLVLKAQEIGFTEEELQTVYLKENNKIIELNNIIMMLDFIRAELGYDENELRLIQMNLDSKSIDLYSLIKKYFEGKNNYVSPVDRIEYYTSSDIIRDIWDTDIKNLNKTRSIVENSGK